MTRNDIVLVVDDSPDSIRLLTDVLEGAGTTVTIALDGGSALRIATLVKPDIVLMDAVMPGMDGFETCRRLKAMSGFDLVPVIFMTGLSEPEDTMKAFQAGGADYVTKPIVVKAVLARIEAHLANARKVRSARMALDATEQFLVATNRNGDILWFTPQAYRLLENRFERNGDQLRLPDDVLGWLNTRLESAKPNEQSETSSFAPKAEEPFMITFIGEGEKGEILFRISDVSAGDGIGDIKARFHLTDREAEVLYWIARGKSNRDIASILSLSPRTVGKHLELIFTKLSVENRTAAAALLLNASPR